MYGNYPVGFGTWDMSASGFTILMMVLAIWSLVWKGWALWRAGRNNSVGWFIALLVLNTLGILEIIYIFAFSGFGKGKVAEASSKDIKKDSSDQEGSISKEEKSEPEAKEEKSSK